MESYCRNQQIIDGELDDNQVMMHLEKGKYFGLNPVGKRIWELIAHPISFEEITDVLLAEFNVEKSTCMKEVEAFLEKALKYEIIERYEVNS